MPSFALSAIGRDRPGIVAAIARVLYEQGCNVEDSSMTLLRGNFAVMLVLAAPDQLTPDGLTDALAPALEDLGLLYDVIEVDDTAEIAHPTHILSVYGADRAGILYRVSDALARNGVNITDLTSRLAGDPASPVYAVLLELAIPPGTDTGTVRAELSHISGEMGIETALRELDEDIL